MDLRVGALWVVLLSVAPVVHAELVRCTSPDGKSSVLRRDKCASPDDIQTPVSVAKPVSKSSRPPGLAEAAAAHDAGDYPKALKLLTPLAEQGNPTAQILLGDLYHNGRAVTKDDAIAYSWNRKAADQGDPGAQVLVGVMHQEGWGTPKDDAQAVTWFRKAADKGFVPAQITMGVVYMKGRGVPKDEAEGMRWIRKAADAGDANSQVLMALAYREGRAGLPKDNGQARAWMSKATAQGEPNARAMLPQMER